MTSTIEDSPDIVPRRRFSSDGLVSQGDVVGVDDPSPDPTKRPPSVGYGSGGSPERHQHHPPPFMRSRRRVRQRVDAGEPRNSYSSIPGFSFKSGQANLVNNNGLNGPPMSPGAFAAAFYGGGPRMPQQQHFHPPNPHHYPHGSGNPMQMYQLQQMMKGPGGTRGPRGPFPHYNCQRFSGRGSEGFFGGPPPPPPPPPMGYGPRVPPPPPPQAYSNYHRFRMLQQQGYGSGSEGCNSPAQQADGGKFNNGVNNQTNSLSVVGDIRAGMAVAACAAAAAAAANNQRSQRCDEGPNDVTTDRPPAGDGEEVGKSDGGGGSSISNASAPNGINKEASKNGCDEEQQQTTADDRGESAPSPSTSNVEEKRSQAEDRSANGASGGKKEEDLNSCIASHNNNSDIDACEEGKATLNARTSIGDFASPRVEVSSCADICDIPVTSNQDNSSNKTSSSHNNNNNFLRDFLQHKFALAAQQFVRPPPLYHPHPHHPHHPRNFHPYSRGVFPPLIRPANRFRMEPALLAAATAATANGTLPPHPHQHHPRGHNNNEFKGDPNQIAAANFMSQLLKMRQEMALNMSNQAPQQQHQQKSATESIDVDPQEDEEEEPIDLQRSNSVHSSAATDPELNNLPRSPSSDLSDKSGSDKKSSRLEQIVSSMQRQSSTSPLPTSASGQTNAVNGCKKRKLYQPMQKPEEASPPPPLVQNENENEEEVVKRCRKEDEDPIEDEDREEQPSQEIQTTDVDQPLQPRPVSPLAPPQPSNSQPPRQRAKQVRDSTKIHPSHMKDSPVPVPMLPSPHMSPATPAAAPLAAAAGPFPAGINPIQAQYMEMARRFLMQEQQDKITKEAITKEILNDTVNKNSDIAAKLMAISPELQGLADILKTEIAASLAIIVDTIVTRYLQAKRMPMGVPKPQHSPHPPPFNLEDSLAALANSSAGRAATMAGLGRAPQVRDRSGPRVTNNHPAMASPPAGLPLPPTLRPAPERPVDVTSDTDMPEQSDMPQDEALSLVVGPKKKRHKVTDSRITPRAMNRALAGADGALSAPSSLSPRGGGPPTGPLFPGINPALAAAAAAAASGLPTSVAIPNPSLAADFNPFSSFYSPPLPNKDKEGSSVHHRSRTPDHRDRRVSGGVSPLPTLIPRPASDLMGSPSAGLAAGANGATDSEKGSGGNDSIQDEMERVQNPMQYMSGYSLSEAHSSTLTPMHLRKAKLMFFWTRYPSSAILKMYFPDIKFNKNNTAQLVKWFSNFREFYYIQMEKYARQALSEGVKSEQDLQIHEDSELYRVLNVHYNRNNHIEVPDHFLPVVVVSLREFFSSIQTGKDTESSWKKQIYKIIARYDEPVPDHFKTQEFLKRLE